ncbi:MAG: gliding motility-associated peptidyl-prolyl isomerase GldI [Flavobacteriaceae bacterium]|nr:gliding motility-associated peptidyl-prolyl isomerase GldI [Flavobacteriaceae bacterium]
MKQSIALFLVGITLYSCKPPEARYPISNTSGSFIKESAERNLRLNKLEYLRIQKIIDADTTNSYLTSANGFWYYYNTKIEGDSITAKFGDIINFDYNIKDLNNKTIYTKAELKTVNYAMDQQELFTGLREGLKLMKSGETVTFLFPSQKGFGYYGDENKIGTNIPLKCEVTVNKITQKKTN